MQALSEAQFQAATQGGVPAPERVFGGDGGAGGAGGAELWSVPVPMRGDFLEYTLSAILRDSDGAVTIVDPGWEGEDARIRLEAVLESIGLGLDDIRRIIVTHAHIDHLGAADELRRLSGAQVCLHEREQAVIDRVRGGRAASEDDVVALLAGWGVPAEAQDRAAAHVADLLRGLITPEPADVLLRDGDELPAADSSWEVVATPGHTSGHICLVDRERRLIFTGDHVLPHIFPGLGLDADWGVVSTDRARGAGERQPVADYLASLDRLRPFDGFEVLPGHGYRFSGLAERRERATAHIVNRAREVAAADAATPGASIWRLASGLTWSAGWDRLSNSRMLPSALRQTGMYRDFVRAGGLAGRG